ncbi:MAG TPA: hypothetical protein VIG62_11920 [Blastocatellia bacterium]|jgi:hypothetical protein
MAIIRLILSIIAFIIAVKILTFAISATVFILQAIGFLLVVGLIVLGVWILYRLLFPRNQVSA